MKNLIITNYEEAFGTYEMPVGAQDTLFGKTVEEQLAFFSVFRTSKQIKSPYERIYTSTHSLPDAYMVKSVIVREGIVVGVMMENSQDQLVPCFIGQSVCSWDTEDSDGDGYNARTDDCRLDFSTGDKE